MMSVPLNCVAFHFKCGSYQTWAERDLQASLFTRDQYKSHIKYFNVLSSVFTTSLSTAISMVIMAISDVYLSYHYGSQYNLHHDSGISL